LPASGQPRVGSLGNPTSGEIWTPPGEQRAIWVTTPSNRPEPGPSSRYFGAAESHPHAVSQPGNSIPGHPRRTFTADVETAAKTRMMSDEDLSSVDELRSRLAALISQGDDLKIQNERLLEDLHEQRRATDASQPSLLSLESGRVLMSESYEGRVISVEGDHVVVVYEVKDDILEQTYLREQFIGHRLPEVGQRLTTVVSVAVTETETPEETGQEDGIGDEADNGPRDPITGPDVF
jgi:hypothetical protein